MLLPTKALQPKFEFGVFRAWVRVNSEGRLGAKNTKLESLKRIEVLRKRGRQCLSQREVAHVTP
jgi:hypothetical protein